MINPKRLIRLTQKIIAINSENPPGREKILSEFIERDMRSLGLKVRTYCFVKDRPNVVATLPGSLPGHKAEEDALLITPHMDTVPIGRGWKQDPLGGRIKNGRIYGRGASDDKGNLACGMEVLRSLVEDRVRLKRDIVLAATVDEETGSHGGIIPLLEKKILRPALALVLDSDELNTVITQKGLIHCRVQIFGKKAHGAYVWRGTNAIELAAEIIKDIKRYRFHYHASTLLKGPTVNVGVIRGGDKVNMVADFCEFALDIRFLPGMRHKDVLCQIRRIISQTARRYKILIDDIQQPYEISRNHPLVKTFMASARSLGAKARLQGSEGATVITFFKKHGIPALATGFTTRGTAHTTDEYVRVKTLIQGAQVLERFIRDFDSR